MKSTSLESGFINRGLVDSSRLCGKSVDDACRLLESMSFDEAYDTVSAYMRQAIDAGKADGAIGFITAIASIDRSGDDIVVRAALMQVVAAALIELGDSDMALAGITDALRLLAGVQKRKDASFKSVLAALLYDLAFLHAARNEYRAAERMLDKAMTLYASLAENSPERYASAHVNVMNAATSIYRSRIRQVNMLAHYQVATSTYLANAATGAPAAVNRLVDSLVKEADTLLKLDRSREAVRYLSRALKYLDKVDDSFTSRKLNVSVMLGDALSRNFSTRQKGVHLLRSLLQNVRKSGDEVQIARIEHLIDEKTFSLNDFLAGWHKLFSRS